VKPVESETIKNPAALCLSLPATNYFLGNFFILHFASHNSQESPPGELVYKSLDGTRHHKNKYIESSETQKIIYRDR
jgi:hypothetical protein